MFIFLSFTVGVCQGAYLVIEANLHHKVYCIVCLWNRYVDRYTCVDRYVYMIKEIVNKNIYIFFPDIYNILIKYVER